MNENTVYLEELIFKLETIKKEHGNLPVFINDADTRGLDDQGWNLNINEVNVYDDGEYDLPKRVLLGGDYHE